MSETDEYSPELEKPWTEEARYAAEDELDPCGALNPYSDRYPCTLPKGHSQPIQVEANDGSGDIVCDHAASEAGSYWGGAPGEEWSVLRTEDDGDSEPEPIFTVNPMLLLPDGTQPRFWTQPEWFEMGSSIGPDGDPVEVLPKPNFSVDEVAKVFFGKGPDWLRWRHSRKNFILDGELYEPPRTAAGHRYYTLADVERLATALTDQNLMDAALLTRIQIQVKLIAETYGYLNAD